MDDKCRICLEGGMLSNIFVKYGSALLSSKIMCLAKVEIYPNDGLPNNICKRCLTSLEKCFEFIKLCEDSDLKLRTLIKQDKSVTEDYCTNWNDDDENEIKIPIINDSFQDLSSVEVNINECPLISEQLNIDEKEYDNVSKLEVQENNLQNEKKTQKQQCFTCGKVMSSRFRLKTHLRTHTGERPFSCPHCSKNFSLAQNLKVHIRVHTGEKPLHCSTCGESFAHSAGLAAHKRKHTGQMPYQCVLCPRTFRTVGHLQYHIRRHTGEKNFECESCGRAFITRGDLKQHLLTHTGARPHVCCVCGMRLTRASHLKRHIQRAHDTQTPFACPHCPMNFIHKEDFEKHKKKHPVTKENLEAAQ